LPLATTASARRRKSPAKAGVSHPEGGCPRMLKGNPHRDNTTKRLHCTGDTRNRTSNNATPTPGTTPAPTALPPRMQWTCIPSRDQHTRPPLRISGAFFSSRNATRCSSRPTAARPSRTEGTHCCVPPRSSKPTNCNVPTHTHDGSSGRLRPPYPGGCNIVLSEAGGADDPVPRGTTVSRAEANAW
jgi:hypothetical protein